MKFDPRPLGEMDAIERRNYVRMLREQARHSQPEPNENSFELIVAMMEASQRSGFMG